MKILAFEFSSDQRSVAVVSTKVLSVASETGTRSVKALVLVEAALREANTAREEIDCLAVGLGPGSYMGIRIAIALAQGWQLARETHTLGVSSVDCLAARAWEEGVRGRVHAAIDAQRNEVYLAAYDLTDGTWKETSPLRLAPMAEAQALAAAGEIVIGPEVQRWCVGGRVLFPSAQHLGLLAATRTDFIPGEQLEPVYLRLANFVKAPPSRQV